MNEPNGAPAVGCWAEFDNTRYVKRGLDETLVAWLTDRTQDRYPLLSLVGSPGVGKSWLLANLHHIAEGEGRFVLLLDARDLLNPNQHDKIKRDLVQRANASCHGLNYPDVLLPSLPAVIEDLAQRLCTRCPDGRFLILVDGCDDLASQDDFDYVQQEYLRRFFVGRCLRMVVARRLGLTEYSLKRLNTTLRVGVFQPGEAESQREKLDQEHWPPIPGDCAYRWNHPYINCYLLAAHLARQPITVETLADCCRSLVDRAHLGNFIQRYNGRDHLTELRHIAKAFTVPWTSSEYRDKIGKDFDAVYVRHGLISVSQDHDMSGPTYTIVDGLRELLQALPD